MGLGLLLCLFALAATAQAPRQRSYPVSSLEIEYPLPHPDHPPIEALLDLEVEMRVTRGGLMQPHPNAPRTRFRLGDIPPGTRFWTTGIQYLNAQILAEFERRGIGGVIITLPDLEDGRGDDLRSGGETRLRVRIWTGRVENISTVADGSRFGGSAEERSNRLEHDYVRAGSPVRAGGERGLIDVRAIEDYARRLSRHPGRRVDAKLRPGKLPGTSLVEYHIAEHKPWTAYAQISNTGTRSTGHLRQRFGLSHTQLTGHDDVLRLDYVTGNFDQVHGASGSYEVPLGPIDRVRLRAFGSWSQYDGSELGNTFIDDFDFSGDQWEAGARATAQVFQRGAFFVDLFASGRWREVGVQNDLLGNGRENFLLPGGGFAAHFDDLLTQFDFEASMEANLDGAAGTDGDSLRSLGRLQADPDFRLLRWNGQLSFFLEPIFYARRGFGDPGSPSRSALAHEVVVRTLGQWSLGDRLTPQFQRVLGGLHTVRGYRQSVVAGDATAFGSAEYRLHLARLIDPGGEPVEVPVIGAFALRPRTVFARADWDLILRIFYDVGIAIDESGGDQRYQEETLAGWGIGAELQLMRHLRAGVDLAWQRSGLDNGDRPSTNPRTHFSVTLTF